MTIKTNPHAEALRTLGRTLSREQMFICFDAANEISSLEGRYNVDMADLAKREQRWWDEFNVQMKRADELSEELERLKNGIKN